jgi:predicted HTH domain antitoxin
MKMRQQSEFKERIIEEINEDIVKKYSLLLLGANNAGKIKEKTKFMKELFLISKNVPELEDEADFEAYNYGPYSDYGSEALEEFEVLNLTDTRNGYELTDLGKEVLLMIKKSISKDSVEMVEDIKQLCNDLNTEEILALVYYTYPEMTGESLVKDRIERRRKSIALSLLRKGKISIGKASEIAGMSISSFYEMLKEKKIKIRMAYP